MKIILNLFFYLFLFVLNLNAVSQTNKLPTIQEAWVDTGYFEWKDSTQTSLKITALGARQKTLPDVYDGEQLRDASYMFSRYISIDRGLYELFEGVIAKT